MAINLNNDVSIGTLLHLFGTVTAVVGVGVALLKKTTRLEMKLEMMWQALMGGHGDQIDIRQSLPFRLAQTEHDINNIFNKLGMRKRGSEEHARE